MNHRILICDSRTWTNRKLVEDTITNIKGYSDITFIHGGASGADNICSRVCKDNNIKQEVYIPNWKKYGKAAGPIRNQEMLNTGVDLVIAFCHGSIVNGEFTPSKGTNDTITRAKSMDIKINIIK
jgi:hypothetical protein